jgi:hypothetical protein
VSWHSHYTIPDSPSSTQPSLLRTSDGRLLLSYGNRGPVPFANGEKRLSVEIRVSEDEGESWGPAMAIRKNLPNMDMGYPTAVELDDGKIACVYWYNSGERMVGPYLTVCRFFAV